MMADDLRSLAGHFRFYAAQGGATIDGRMCALIADNLDSVADTAEAMHGQAAHARPAGVVSLAQARAERAARRTCGDWGAA